MSRLAKKPIIVPQGVVVEFKDGQLMVKGSKGELSRRVPSGVAFDISTNEIYVSSVGNEKGSSPILGTFVRHLENMIEGVTKGFEKKLELEGVGFKAELKGSDLVLSLGFSHKIEVSPPEGVIFSVEKNVITVSGLDKEKVGNSAAIIRSHKKPEPYKGKGIRYAGEVVRRKAGKKMATTA